MDGGVSLYLRGLGNGSFAAEWPYESGISVDGDAQSLLVTDLNDDQSPDVVFGVNDRPWSAFVSHPRSTGISVRLKGRKGNSTGIGARVELQTENESLVQEVYAGCGYLTQGSGNLFFACEPSKAKSIRVRWPDGTTSKATNISTRMVLNISPLVGLGD